MRISLIFLLLCGLTAQAVATETRVDSTGSIDMVLWDETSDLTPYNFGNPAGMALLPSGGEVGLNIPWFQVSSSNYNGSFFGLSPGVYQGFPDLINTTSGLNNTAGLQYQGFNYVTPDKWALQATGSYSDNQFPLGDSILENAQLGHGLIRVAHEFGPLSVGTEFQYTTGTYYLTGGNNLTGNVTGPSQLNMGILANIQLGNDQHPCWLRLGGSVGFDLSPGQTESISGSGNSITTYTYATANTVISPCVFLEIPGSLQAGVIVNATSDATSISASFPSGSGLTSGGPDLFETYTNNINLVFCKWKMTLSPSQETNPLSLNCGILFGVTSETVSAPGDIYNNFNLQSSQLQIGMGLERSKNFTIGLQLDAQANNLTQSVATEPNSSGNLIEVCLGMEKWLSPEWALRLGLVYQNEPTNDGFNPEYFNVPVPMQETAWMTTLGIGYDVKNFKIDAMTFLDPESVGAIGVDSGNTTTTYTIFGFELSAEVLFDN